MWWQIKSSNHLWIFFCHHHHMEYLLLSDLRIFSLHIYISLINFNPGNHCKNSQDMQSLILSIIHYRATLTIKAHWQYFVCLWIADNIIKQFGLRLITFKCLYSWCYGNFLWRKAKPGGIWAPEIVSSVFQSIYNLYQISSAWVLKGIINE